MRAHTSAVRDQGGRIGFVPTMGALHDGHLALVDYARERCDEMVVSIFVNPLQFDREDDLKGYPRTWQADLELCAAHGVDVVYYPSAEAMYPPGFQTKVSLGPITQGLCGAFRPGHFDGVTTVVLKLFNAVQPHLAVFGEKDYQQLKVIQHMTRDLDLGVEVIGRPTVREADGLAMSSRNNYLDESERKRAPALYHALASTAERLRSGRRDFGLLEALAVEQLEAAGLKCDYFSIRRAADLGEPQGSRELVILAAAFLGKARLIDNLEVKLEQ